MMEMAFHTWRSISSQSRYQLAPTYIPLPPDLVVGRECYHVAKRVDAHRRRLVDVSTGSVVAPRGIATSLQVTAVAAPAAPAAPTAPAASAAAPAASRLPLLPVAASTR